LININVTACMSSAVGFYILWQHFTLFDYSMLTHKVTDILAPADHYHWVIEEEMWKLNNYICFFI